MISYIYGVIYPIDEIVKFCNERGILIVEDLAESYIGNHYIGNKNAIMSLFSFGSIKRYTAFAGGIAFIRDKVIYEKMNKIHENYPTQRKREFLKKILKVAAMGLLLNNQQINYSTKKVSGTVNFDYKEFVVKNLRGFNPAGDYLGKFRKKPTCSILNFLYFRLSRFDKQKFIKGNAKLQRALEKLTSRGIKIPGSEIQNRSFWLFPVIMPDVFLR